MIFMFFSDGQLENECTGRIPLDRCIELTYQLPTFCKGIVLSSFEGGSKSVR